MRYGKVIVDKKGLGKIAAAIVCVGLAYLGFEYDNGWAFAGSLLCLGSILDC